MRDEAGDGGLTGLSPVDRRKALARRGVHSGKRIALGFAIAFLACWGVLSSLTALAITGRPHMTFGGWRGAWWVGTSPIWVGVEPFWSALREGHRVYFDDLCMIALGVSAAMVASIGFSIKTGRWIPAAGACMALYWIMAFMIVGVAF